MSVLRLLERVMGEGDFVRDGTRVLRAAYELARYEELAVDGGELELKGEVVDGHVFASPEALDPLLGLSSPLTLQLDDGRRCDVFIVNGDGVVTSADERGFYVA